MTIEPIMWPLRGGDPTHIERELKLAIDYRSARMYVEPERFMRFLIAGVYGCPWITVSGGVVRCTEDDRRPDDVIEAWFTAERIHNRAAFERRLAELKRMPRSVARMPG